MRKLNEVLAGRESTEHILPFFWQHGEPHEVLLEEIEAIYNTGLREFCVESRTHEEFCRDKWWEDFGFILAEAKKRGMRVWLLDDKRFPTGYANGAVSRHPEYRKKLLDIKYRDFAGPMTNAHIIPCHLGAEDKLVTVIAYKRTHSGTAFSGIKPIPLTVGEDGLIRWDIPEGYWRVFYVYQTYAKGNYAEHIDMLTEAACGAMLEEVYEPTYAHFSEYFGNTFVGFFSDEPCMGNENGNYNSKLGKPHMPLPWRADIPQLISDSLGNRVTAAEVVFMLPMLFFDYESEPYTERVLRCAYMEVITKLYSECFTRQIGDWCREHGVLYIGHIIEDMNTHQRLGYGPGHYFRALQYQDMAGMDIVLQQLIPGITGVDHSAPVCGDVTDPEFFNYYIAKLAASLAHLEPRMKGRAMCEIYGAFGWAEGIPMMKQLTDHMFSNGINYFVPHAFTPKYPDYDCPPHFYARGMNGQYEAFGGLMDYMRRGANLLSGGKHSAPIALLYTPEAEWSGGSYTLPQRTGKELIQSQLDYDILWEDILDRVTVANGMLCVGEECFSALLVPYCEFLPDSINEQLQRIAQEGGEVCYCDETGALPECVYEYAELTVEELLPLLRYYHYVQEDGEVYFFYSEDIHSECSFTVDLPSDKPCVLYDAWENRVYSATQEGNRLKLVLPPYGSIFVLQSAGDGLPEADTAPWWTMEECAAEPSDVKVSVCAVGASEYTNIEQGKGLDLTELLPGFSGTIRYEADIELQGDEKYISLGEVGELAKVTLNGKPIGTAAFAPYTLPLDGNALAGRNHIIVEVVNNLAYRERDELSTYLPLPRSGWFGPVTVYR